MMNCGQFEQRGRDLAGKLDSLNKEKSKLLLEVGKLEQEAEVMTADRGALDSRPPFGEQTTFTGGNRPPSQGNRPPSQGKQTTLWGTDHPCRGTDHPHRVNRPPSWANRPSSWGTRPPPWGNRPPSWRVQTKTLALGASHNVTFCSNFSEPIALLDHQRSK